MVALKMGIFSDTHVGRAFPTVIGELRRKAYAHAFREAIDIFIEHGVDYVIHGGDLFEKKSMRPRDTAFVKAELHRLFESIRERHGKTARIFVTRGNHDGALDSSAIDFVTHPVAQYLHVVGDGIIRGERELYFDGQLSVTGLGYSVAPLRRLREAKPLLTELLRDAKGTKVLLLHTYIEGYHQLPPAAARGSIPLGDLEDIPVDLIVCGHYHGPCEPSHLQSGALLVTPGGTEAEDLSDIGQHGVYILEDGQASFVPIDPLHEIRQGLVNSKGATKSAEWFLDEAMELASAYAADLAAREREGVLRLVLEGVVDGDPFDLERSLEMKLRGLRDTSVRLLYAHLESRLEPALLPLAAPAMGGRDEFLRAALEPLDPLLDEALELALEVDVAVEQKRSERTGILTESDRKPFVDRWERLLERLEMR